MEVLRKKFKFFYYNYILLFRRKRIHILSDSHGEVFKYVSFSSLGNDVFPKYCIVPGATASGLVNPNSKTQAFPLFMNHLESFVFKKDYIILLLGEVDCGFAIWIRAEKHGISVTSQLKTTLGNYFNFIKNLKGESKRIIVCSAIPPTIKDGVSLGEVANLRKIVKASQKDRTDLTRKFNQELKKFCAENNFMFLDLDEILIDQKTGTVKEYFMNVDPKDHHLDHQKLAEVINTFFRK